MKNILFKVYLLSDTSAVTNELLSGILTQYSGPLRRPVVLTNKILLCRINPSALTFSFYTLVNAKSKRKGFEYTLGKTVEQQISK